MIPKDYKIDRRYRVEKNLGDGLSGEVLLVSDNGELRALKFLKKVQLNVSREEALQNFKNEFSILKELNHPNIARILDFGFDEKLRKYYFTTEYVAAGDLDKACQGKSLEEKEKVFVQVLRALNYLHSRGIFHFDIKPQNILISDNDGELQAKVIDFGLAGFGSPGKKVGTPIYMAPEVILGAHLDSRTDLYSTAVMFYALFSGQNPFLGKSYKEISEKQLKLVPKPITNINPEVPNYWEHILKRMLEKDPNQRYSQASLVIRDLNFLSGKKFEIETKDTKLSYLPEKGTLIAREKQWETFQNLFERVFAEENNSKEKLLVVAGEKGTGKTRLLSEIKYFSQLQNVPVKTLEQYELERENLDQPFLLQIDNPHVRLPYINRVLSEVIDKPCLIVWTQDEVPSHLSGAIVVELGNYDKPELKTYLESVTGLMNAPDNLIEEVYKRTQGNPYFVTEFIKSLLEQNLFYDESGKWDVSTFEDIKIDFDKIEIPESLEVALKNKWEGLQQNQKRILEWLSVNQNPLPIDFLKTLMAGQFFQEDLQDLLHHEFLDFHFDQSVGFKNVILKNVVLGQIPKADKIQFHARLADVFAKSNKYKKQYLYHQSFSSQNPVAKQALLTLAEMDLAAEGYEKAIATLTRFVKISKDHFEKTDFQVYLNLANFHSLTRQYAKANEVCLKLLALISNNTEFSANEQIQVYVKLIDIHNKQNSLEEVATYCNQAEKILEKVSNRKTYELILSNYRAHLLYKNGDADQAMREFEENRQIWQNKLSAEQKVLVMNNRLSDIYWGKQEFDKAIAFCVENIDVLKGSEHKYYLALNYYQLGDYLYRKSFSVAENEISVMTKFLNESKLYFENCMSISKEIHHYNLLLRAYHGLGNVCYTQNNKDEALEYYKRSLAIAQKIGEEESAASTAFNIANIHIADKNFKESYSYLVYATNAFDHLDSISAQSHVTLYLCHLSLAEVYGFWGECDKAHTAIDQAEKIFQDKPQLKSYEYWMVIRRAIIYFKQQKYQLAYECYEKAKSLASTVEEKEDLKVTLSNYNFEKSNKNDDQNKLNEVRVMSYNPSNANSNTNDLHKIIEINQIINSQYNFSELIKVVLNYAIQLSQAEGGAVLLLNDAGEFEVSESTNLSDQDKNAISYSIASQAIKTGEIVESSDAVSDERFDGSQSIVVNDLQSVLCLPILSKNKPVGVFYLDNRYKKNAFQSSNLVLLKAFCDQVGIALQNAKLIHDLQSARDELSDDLSRTQEKLDEVKEILHEEVGHYSTEFGKSIISKSKAMHDVFRVMDKVKNANISIFVYGESGTGKELIAKALHHSNTDRSKNRFVAINCGAIPSNLIESELFGHKQGSFTGAIRDKKGMFEEANGGTLFLDEIGELPMELQVKLLRVLQEGEVQRIGDNQTIKVDVRVISASHQDIEKMVKTKRFREDLYYRLCQMRIDIPPLRARTEDIPELIKHFVKKYAKENRLDKVPDVPATFLKPMMNYDWPGNVRELENLVSVACALKEGDTLSLDNLPEHYGLKSKAVQLSQGFAGQNTSVSLPIEKTKSTFDEKSFVKVEGENIYRPRLTWKEYEALIIAKAYKASKWQKKVVADWLQVSHSTVYKKLDDYNLHDRNNPIYQQDFVYNQQLSLKEYVEKVFLASLKHHEDHPYAAIKLLDVSQGYFYKVIKGKRHLIHQEEESGASS